MMGAEAQGRTDDRRPHVANGGRIADNFSEPVEVHPAEEKLVLTQAEDAEGAGRCKVFPDDPPSLDRLGMVEVRRRKSADHRVLLRRDHGDDAVDVHRMVPRHVLARVVAAVAKGQKLHEQIGERLGHRGEAEPVHGVTDELHSRGADDDLGAEEEIDVARGTVVWQKVRAEERAQPGLNDRTLLEVESIPSGDNERDGLAEGGVQSEKAFLEGVWRGHRASMFWRSSSKMRARTCSAVSLSRFSPEASSR